MQLMIIQNILILKSCYFGGISIKDQEKKLNVGVDIAVATTGRLLEHIKTTL